MRKIVFKVSEVVLRDVEIVEDLDEPGATVMQQPAPEPCLPSAREVEFAERLAESEQRSAQLAGYLDEARREHLSVQAEKEVLVRTCDHLRSQLAEDQRRAREAEAKASDMPSLRQGNLDKERTITGLRQTLEASQAESKRWERIAFQTEEKLKASEHRYETACALRGLTLSRDELALVIKEIDIGVAHGRIRRDAVGQAVIEKLYAARGDA